MIHVKKFQTASDFLNELEQDPEHRARRAAQDRKLEELKAVYDKDQETLVAEIRERGYNIDSVWDLGNNVPHPIIQCNFIGPYTDAYPILVKHLNISHHPKIREGIIRALTESDANVVAAKPLLQQFKTETDVSLCWVLANALQKVLTRKQKKDFSEYKDVLKG